MKKILLFFITFFIALDVFATQNGNSTTATYLNLNGGGKIVINIGESKTTLITSKSNREIEIKDFNKYYAIFLTNDKENYPKYVLETTENYEFSDFKKNESSIKNAYILSSKINVFSLNDALTDISSCESLFGYNFINLLKNNVFKIIYYLIPIILVITSTLDFAKIIFTDDKDGLNGALNKLLKRVIASILIFLVPTILIFFTNIFSSDEVKMCIDTFKSTENLNDNS